VVNGVLADPTEGPDSSLYEAMGYTRKSERKSGLTRGKKSAGSTPPTSRVRWANTPREPGARTSI